MWLRRRRAGGSPVRPLSLVDLAEFVSSVLTDANTEFDNGAGRTRIGEISLTVWSLGTMQEFQAGRTQPLSVQISAVHSHTRPQPQVRITEVTPPGHLVVTRAGNELRAHWDRVSGARRYQLHILGRNGSPVRGQPVMSLHGTSAVIRGGWLRRRRWHAVAVAAWNGTTGPQAVTTIQPA
jgi:hypothetical protein